MHERRISLPPAPSTPDVLEGLRRVGQRLDELDAIGETVGNTLTPENAAVRLLRRRLAVRGWVSPMCLLNDLPNSAREKALEILASEVELAERTRPGQWFLTLSARKLIFASTAPALLREAAVVAYAGDESDPVRLALLIALDVGPTLAMADTEQLQTLLAVQRRDVLQELARMAAWGSSLPGVEALAATAGAERKRQARNQELEFMGATTIFGRDVEQQRIRGFLRSPSIPRHVRTLYVSGVGGSGKSTLLLAAEKELRNQACDLVIRLDFDSPYLDPRSPEQMDIMFLRALAVEEPRIAHKLQKIIWNLQSLVDYRMRARIEAEGSVQSNSSSRTVERNFAQIERAKYAHQSGSATESSGISQQYERISALSNLSSTRELLGRDLVLFVDTLENVGRLGPDGIDSALEWLASIIKVLPQCEVRLVLAGRDPLASPSMQGFSNRFRDHGIALHQIEELVLENLRFYPALALLMQFEMPNEDAALAAKALPGNPLVLRLAARTYQANKADLTAIQDAYRHGRVDPQTANAYLTQRILHHVPYQLARRYVIAAMALPEFTERLLRDTVIPAVDGAEIVVERTFARKVYEGLLRASWLTVERSPGTLQWHTELRALTLPMIQADSHHVEVIARVHSAAALWYEQRTTSSNRLMAAYYWALANKRPLNPALADLIRRYLGRWAGGWAEQYSPFGAQPLGDGRANDTELYRMRLEGTGGHAGEGDRLVAQGHAMRALELYRHRPTRQPGMPPTFVIRALVSLGDLYGEMVEPKKVLLELSQHLAKRQRKIPRQAVERLYWLTRLEMLKGDQLLSLHLELLRDACRNLKFNQQNGALFGLVGILEPLQTAELKARTTDPEDQIAAPLRYIAPAAWPPSGADAGPELRFSMVRTTYGRLYSAEGKNRWVSTTLGAMLVLDERWCECLRKYVWLQVIQLSDSDVSVYDLPTVMQSLRQAPLVEVERFIANCRNIRVRIDLARIAPTVAPLLLRGTLVELHAPLAAVLSAPGLWPKVSEPSDRLLQLLNFIKTLRLHSGVILTLAEFESKERRKNLARNFEAAISALVVTLDRANALAEFCRVFCSSSPPLFGGTDAAAMLRVRDLCTRYLEWDRALDPKGIWRLS